MHADVLPEPELEFGGGGRHVDPRFGITDYGPADLNDHPHGRVIRVGLVAPGESVDGLARWLDRCRDEIPAKDNRYPHLFTSFPGCDVDRGLRSTLILSPRTTRTISGRVLEQVAAAEPQVPVELAVAAYAEEARALAEGNRCDVVLIARPVELRDTATRPRGGVRDRGVPRAPLQATFRELLKSALLDLSVPIQVVRRSTWDENHPPPAGSGRQDEATRAWNLHVAVHYKAGGVPWRLPRDPHDLTTCFIGVSFYNSILKDTVDSSVAQVFNERGDGVIVRGGAATRSSEDRQPHLTEQAAYVLLTDALDAYRREHRTAPARVTLHKSSRFDDAEVAGLTAAANDRDIDELDVTWVTRSDDLRLFRPGTAPPLRGTYLHLTDDAAVLYTKGSIDFYKTYPGMHIPQPIGLRHARRSRSGRDLANETLALSKMNWNQTRLDGQFPVTLHTAEQVKAVLRHRAADQQVATRYAHYM